MEPLRDRHVLVGVSGSISAYKACELVRELRAAGATVRVLPTKSAQAFVTPLTFEALSGMPCLTDALQMAEGRIPHVEEAYRADLFVVCPASADVMAKMAHGFADEALLSTLLSYTGPLVVAPAMETHMWEHPATQANLVALQARGARVVGPDEGPLASGRSGRGRLAPVARVVEACREAVSEPDLAGRHVLVTAGPTVEDVDPVRYLTNRSSGKMGAALARVAHRRGARVTLVHGPLEVPVPEGDQLTAVPVRSAEDMHRAVMAAVDTGDVDAAILCAAVADYRPAAVAERKLKKERGELTAIPLAKNPDILRDLGARSARPFLVGFAAETDDVEANAREKLTRKRADVIAANDVSRADSGFGADTNRVVLLFQDGREEHLAPMPKDDVAGHILDAVRAGLSSRSGS